MPIYEYECPSCEVGWEEIRPVDERDCVRCPCGTKANRLISMPRMVRSDPKNWSDENGGRGRYISQLQTTLGSKIDPNAYCRSQAEALQKARSRGDKAEIVG